MEEALCAERQGKWLAAIGRFSNRPADAISEADWQGLSTAIAYGISDEKTGFHTIEGRASGR